MRKASRLQHRLNIQRRSWARRVHKVNSGKNINVSLLHSKGCEKKVKAPQVSEAAAAPRPLLKTEKTEESSAELQKKSSEVTQQSCSPLKGSELNLQRFRLLSNCAAADQPPCSYQSHINQKTLMVKILISRLRLHLSPHGGQKTAEARLFGEFPTYAIITC